MNKRVRTFKYYASHIYAPSAEAKLPIEEHRHLQSLFILFFFRIQLDATTRQALFSTVLVPESTCRKHVAMVGHVTVRTPVVRCSVTLYTCRARAHSQINFFPFFFCRPCRRYTPKSKGKLIPYSSDFEKIALSRN